jgi:cytochrome c553
MKHSLAVIGLLSALVAGTALAEAGNAEAGAQKAVICGACHGVNGNSINPEWPNLASQHAGYIVDQLKLFKAGVVRNNPIMMPNAMMLTDQDMLDVAAYFSKQPLQGLEADPALVKAGEALYRGGDAARGISACIGCHGPDGSGNAPAKYPSVRAQHSVYQIIQLKAFAAGQRNPPGNDMMQTISKKLTEDEMRAVAAYMQGLR